MLLTFVVDPTTPLVRVHGVGSLTLADFRDAVNALTRVGGATYPRLVDLCDAKVHISSADIRRYVAFKEAHISAHLAVRIANVTNDLLTYGMLRRYQALIATYEPDYGVFRTLPGALDLRWCRRWCCGA